MFADGNFSSILPKASAEGDGFSGSVSTILSTESTYTLLFALNVKGDSGGCSIFYSIAGCLLV